MPALICLYNVCYLFIHSTIDYNGESGGRQDNRLAKVPACLGKNNAAQNAQRGSYRVIGVPVIVILALLCVLRGE